MNIFHIIIAYYLLVDKPKPGAVSRAFNAMLKLIVLVAIIALILHHLEGPSHL